MTTRPKTKPSTFVENPRQPRAFHFCTKRIGAGVRMCALPPLGGQAPALTTSQSSNGSNPCPQSSANLALSLSLGTVDTDGKRQL